jgi:hypothetical protein
MFEFLKTLLIVLWIYYALKFLVRWLFPRILPWMMKQIFKRAAQSNQPFGSQNGTAFDSFTNRASGDKHDKKENPKSKKVVGEYIDFEEIED